MGKAEKYQKRNEMRGKCKWNTNQAVVQISGYLSLKGINDELQCVGVHTLDTLLNHVIAILIFDTLQHVTIKLHYKLVLLSETNNVRESW